MIVGLDARPALFGRTGFGRVVRETLRALRARDDVTVRAYGAAWRRPRGDADAGEVCTPRLPARLQQLLAPLGFGVERVLGPLDVFHHTDLVHAPVRRTPEVLTVYDLHFLGDRWHAPGFTARVAPRLARRASAARRVVVPHASVAEDVVARGLAEAGKVVVAPLGCDHVAATPEPDDRARVDLELQRVGVRRSGRPLVLVPGTREPRKNQAALLDAFCSLAPGSALLVFVGPRGWGCEELERRLDGDERVGRRPAHGAAPPPVSEHRDVAVLDEVPEDTLGCLLRQADVVAYPSLAEGFGLPVVEALALGRAVLTSTGTPMADLGGDAVLAVDPRDPAALSAGLAELLADPSGRAQRGGSGRERVRGLTWASHAEALVHVYRACIP